MATGHDAARVPRHPHPPANFGIGRPDNGGETATVSAKTESDDRGDPEITLGRRQFAVPEFTWRELKKLMPAMRACTKVDFANLTEDDMNVLGDLMWMVVVRDPEWDGGRDDFDNLPMRLGEILKAIPVITRQAGMEPAKAGEADAAGSA